MKNTVMCCYFDDRKAIIHARVEFVLLTITPLIFADRTKPVRPPGQWSCVELWQWQQKQPIDGYKARKEFEKGHSGCGKEKGA